MTSYNKTCNRMEDGAADRVIGGDTSSAQVDPDQMCLTSFGDDSTGPRTFPYSRDDALVNKGAAAPKPCLSPMEMRTLTAAGDLLPTGTAFRATMTIFHQPPFWFYSTEEIQFRTSIKYTTDYITFWKMKVLETKSRQNLAFDPGGHTSRLGACPFLGAWLVLLCEVFVWAPDGTRRWSVFWQLDGLEYHFSRERYKRLAYAKRIAVDYCFSAARLI